MWRDNSMAEEAACISDSFLQLQDHTPRLDRDGGRPWTVGVPDVEPESLVQRLGTWVVDIDI